MKNLATRLSLALIASCLLVWVDVQATISYPLPPSLPTYSVSDFKPPLERRCLAVTVNEQWNQPRAVKLTVDFREDGSIANAKLARDWGWEDRDTPAIELSAEDFAINYGWLTMTRDSWKLQAFSHRHTDSYATTSFGLIIYRQLNDDASVGDMTKIHLVIFEQRDGKERIFRSTSSAIRCCSLGGCR